MKRFLLVPLMTLTAAVCAPAQITTVASDVLGAHLNSGRGCAACHAPHSGAAGNGNEGAADSTSGNAALWGENAAGLYGKTIASGGGKYVEVLPASMSAATPDAMGILTCLTCHDGNYASSAMMKNRVYETLPPTYATSNAIPTRLGVSVTGAGNYAGEHPVGLSAKINCGGKNWDCVEAGGEIRMTGANSRRFAANYGFFVKPGVYGNAAVVMCTTCHEPHRMNVFTVTADSGSGLPRGNYATMFFIRGPYNPRDTNSNQTAQFCRQCHAELSNEMNGSMAGTVF